MSAENIKELKEYAEFIGMNPDFYDISEQVYNGKAETVLTWYIDKEHTQELESHYRLD